MNAVILAGGGRDAVCAQDPSAINKAFVRVAGKAMVARVIEAAAATPGITRTIVVAPITAHGSPDLAHADECRDAGATITQSLRAGLSRMPADEPVLLCTSDAPLLSGAALHGFLKAAQLRDLDVAYAIVERATHRARFPDAPHTWARMREGTYCGGAAVRLRPRVLPALADVLASVAAARKSPLRLAALFGWDVLLRFALRTLSISDAEARASAMLAAPTGAIVSPDAEVAFNVDRETDLALAHRYAAALTSSA